MPDAPWHQSVLPPNWGDAATAVSAGVSKDFYLAGGTGLALQLGHRTSIDLDLFSAHPFDPLAIRDRLRTSPGFSVQQVAEHTLHSEIASVSVSFLHYPHPLLFGLRAFGDLPVADRRDIACMKLDALSSRGSRRDFVDLYFVLREIALPELLELFDRKYQAVAPNRVHLMKALTYFVDAEQEPMPHMLEHVSWTAVREFFEREVRRQF